MSDHEFSSASAEHYTPAWLIEIAREVMGGIDLDPCSSEKAQETVRAWRWYSVDDDGLLPRSPWFGRVWCNPPGDRSGKLVQRFWLKLWKADVLEFMWLCFNISQLRTLQPQVGRCHVCVLSKRIAFTGPSPTRDNAVLYYGPHTDRFVKRMRPHGVVWRPIDG